jgi:hypothetical protein
MLNQTATSRVESRDPQAEPDAPAELTSIYLLRSTDLQLIPTIVIVVGHPLPLHIIVFSFSIHSRSLSRICSKPSQGASKAAGHRRINEPVYIKEKTQTMCII